MTHSQTITLRQRLVAVAAATLMTLLVAGSQLGLSDHYTAEADALLAAQRSQAPMAAAARPTAAARS